MILKFGMQHWKLRFYKVYINSNPGLTVTNFTARPNVVTEASLLEQVKTVNILETIAACDLNVSRCRQLIELMKVCEY